MKTLHQQWQDANPDCTVNDLSMTTYKVTIVMTADTHPRKWLFETIDQALDRNQNEDILEWEIEEVTE